MSTTTPEADLRRTPRQLAWYLARRAWWLEIWGYVSIFRFVFRRPKVPAGATAFSYHAPVIVLIWAFIVVSAVELVVVDLLLHRWPSVRYPVLALGVWGLVWMFGLLFGFLTRPHAVGPDGLRIRSGAEVEVPLGWELVESVRRHKQVAQGKQPDVSVGEHGERTLHLRMQHETNVEVRLREPVVVRLPRGSETVTRLHVYVDEPGHFLAEVERHRAA
jgi:hypothetical protein